MFKTTCTGHITSTFSPPVGKNRREDNIGRIFWHCLSVCVGCAPELCKIVASHSGVFSERKGGSEMVMSKAKRGQDLGWCLVCVMRIPETSHKLTRGAKYNTVCVDSRARGGLTHLTGL